MSYFLLLSKPFKPVLKRMRVYTWRVIEVYTIPIRGIGLLSPSHPLWTWGESNPRPNSFFSDTLRFSL